MNRRSFIGSGIGLGAMTAGALMRGSFAEALGDGPASGAVVETTSGKIRGTKLADGKVHCFKGVPYGASTAGSGRFLPPARPMPWSGVRETTAYGLRAPQLDSQFRGVVIPEFAAMDPGGPMGEDCLVLNLWTPGGGRAPKRPVMVWLHGGGYTTGSGAFVCYDGTELARKHDVVVVTVNHRLGVFGYLYLAELGGEKYAQASNAGMLDIVAALEWVRDNAEKFGGDPGNVTIFGQSGGGGKVSALMAMPPAKGLFHRAIVESGADVRGVPKEVATKSGAAFMEKLGLQSNQVDQLQQMPMDQLLTAMGAMTGSGLGGGLALAPVVDGTTLPVNPFDPVAPLISRDIPLLIGTVETEVTFFPGQQLDPIDDAGLHARVKGVVRKADDAQIDQLIAAYRAGRPKASNTDLFLIIASDATFRAGVVLEAERKAAPGNAPVYQYYFTWRSPVRDGKLRTFHTLEIPFVFDNVDAAKSMTGDGADRYALATAVSGAWVAFARTGNPNHPGLPDWPAFDTTRRATMILNDECKAVDDPYGEAQRMLRTLQNS
ncbi:MAG: carboxylesterase/lipase family protein [Candidatus Acidiferrales bacterium]